MKTVHTFTLSLSLLDATVQAAEIDPGHIIAPAVGERSRQEVRAQAVAVARSHGTEPAGSRVIAPRTSTLSCAEVRAQAVEALRLRRLPVRERERDI